MYCRAAFIFDAQFARRHGEDAGGAGCRRDRQASQIAGQGRSRQGQTEAPRGARAWRFRSNGPVNRRKQLSGIRLCRDRRARRQIRSSRIHASIAKPYGPKYRKRQPRRSPTDRSSGPCRSASPAPGRWSAGRASESGAPSPFLPCSQALRRAPGGARKRNASRALHHAWPSSSSSTLTVDCQTRAIRPVEDVPSRPAQHALQTTLRKWSEREDLNLRPPAPHGALEVTSTNTRERALRAE